MKIPLLMKLAVLLGVAPASEQIEPAPEKGNTQRVPRTWRTVDPWGWAVNKGSRQQARRAMSQARAAVAREPVKVSCLDDQGRETSTVVRLPRKVRREIALSKSGDVRALCYTTAARLRGLDPFSGAVRFEAV